MPVAIVSFLGMADQQIGLKRFGCAAPNTLYLFPNVMSTTLVTEGLTGAIRIVCLDAALRPLSIGHHFEFTMAPEQMALLPLQTRHVIEADADTPILPHLDLIRQRLSGGAA
jgi:hypothetical protein